MCVCVCVCARACVCVYAYAYVCVCVTNAAFVRCKFFFSIVVFDGTNTL